MSEAPVIRPDCQLAGELKIIPRRVFIVFLANQKKNSEDKKDGEDDAMDVDKEGDTTEKKKKKREPEPTSFKIGNPSRITKAQSEYCVFDLTQRYRPVRPDESPYGVIVLSDSTPDQEEDVGAVMAPSLEPDGELAPPEAFVWKPPPPPPVPTKTEVKSEDKGDKKDGDEGKSDDVKMEEA